MQFLETRDKIVHRRLKNNSVHLQGTCVLAGEKLVRILPFNAGEPKADNGILSLLAAGEGHYGPLGSSDLALRTAVWTFEAECTKAGILEAGIISGILNTSE